MGIRLIRKEVFTVFVMVVGVFLRVSDRRGKIMGVERVARVSRAVRLRTNRRSITFTWICTKMGGS